MTDVQHDCPTSQQEVSEPRYGYCPPVSPPFVRAVHCSVASPFHSKTPWSFVQRGEVLFPARLKSSSGQRAIVLCLRRLWCKRPVGPLAPAQYCIHDRTVFLDPRFSFSRVAFTSVLGLECVPSPAQRILASALDYSVTASRVPPLCPISNPPVVWRPSP